MARTALTIATLVALAAFSGLAPVAAQTVPNSSPQGRDCQTVRVCNFARGAEVRGCLSSYSCRTCRMTTVANCKLGPGRVCQEMRCGWGG